MLSTLIGGDQFSELFCSALGDLSPGLPHSAVLPDISCHQKQARRVPRFKSILFYFIYRIHVPCFSMASTKYRRHDSAFPKHWSDTSLLSSRKSLMLTVGVFKPKDAAQRNWTSERKPGFSGKRNILPGYLLFLKYDRRKSLNKKSVLVSFISKIFVTDFFSFAYQGKFWHKVQIYKNITAK